MLLSLPLCFSTFFSQAPYIIYVEVVEVDDIYSSPVPTKIMPTLRHTKSEENLGHDSLSLSAFSVCGGCYDDNDPDWSQEDDEISQQVCGNLFIIYLFFCALRLYLVVFLQSRSKSSRNSYL